MRKIITNPTGIDELPDLVSFGTSFSEVVENLTNGTTNFDC